MIHIDQFVDLLVDNWMNLTVRSIDLFTSGPNSLPKAYIRASRVTVDEGQTAFLHCDVTGDRPMDITWRKYGGTLSRTAVMKENYLEIKRTTIRDRGRYVCTATNRYGNGSAIGSLYINKGMRRCSDIFWISEPLLNSCFPVKGVAVRSS